jgi:hypothetical protein
MAALDEVERTHDVEKGSEGKESGIEPNIEQEVLVTENATTIARAEITGWKLNAVLCRQVCRPLVQWAFLLTKTSSLSAALLLSSLETTIVATTLVTISSSFGQFNLAEWVVVAYLLTYTGFLIVFARLSDFFGRKNAILAALIVFTVFSGICGAAQSMEQL